MLELDLELRQLSDELLMVGEELVERRIQQTDHDREAVHDPEESFEIAALEGEESIEGVLALYAVPGHDHLPHDRESILLEEHVLRAAKADPLCPQVAGPARIVGVIRVRPHLEGAELVRPTQQLAEPGVLEVRYDGRKRAKVDFSAHAIDGDLSALADREIPDPRLAVDQVDLESLHPDDSRLAELARDQRRVAGPSPPAGDDPLRREHTVNVVGPRLGPDHDHGLPFLLGPSLCRVRIEGHDAHGRSGRHVQPVRKHTGRASGALLELRMEIEIHLLGTHPEHGLLPAKESLFDHVHRDPHFRLGSTLAVPGLEKPQRSVLDGELEILHVSVVALKLIRNLTELLVGIGEPIRHHADVEGLPGSVHHVFPLGVHKEVPVQAWLSGGRIAARHDPRPAIVAHVPEDHGLDVDRRADVVRDSRRVPVVDCTFRIPGLEYRFRGRLELLQGFGRERRPRMCLDELLEALSDSHPVLRPQLRVRGDPGGLSSVTEDLFEHLVFHPADHGAEHLDQPSVGVVDEARVSRELHHSLGHFVVHSQIQDRVHHPGHGELRAGATRHQEGFFGVAEFFARISFDALQGLDLLFPDVLRKPAFFPEIGDARLGGHGEARGHGDLDPRHLRQIRALTSEQPADRLPVIHRGFHDFELGEQIHPLPIHFPSITDRSTSEA